ncbi:hypothetical protein U9M48_011123 [Paspalum notatum var. saurae]|uniref:DUF7795 domain-containing protein n=1 Tax=Paspalum notatum var. saurae TaxID=547442 RepID=A0AAQ3WH10_PASNO
MQRQPSTRGGPRSVSAAAAASASVGHARGLPSALQCEAFWVTAGHRAPPAFRGPLRPRPKLVVLVLSTKEDRLLQYSQSIHFKYFMSTPPTSGGGGPASGEHAAASRAPTASSNAAADPSQGTERPGKGEASAMLDTPQANAAGEDESTCRGVFIVFMTKVAQFEELAESGERLLMRFRQELEYFQRPPIPKESDVMNQIVKSNCTVRMRSYLQAGCRLHCPDISNINQLSSSEDGLKDHINKVKILIKEIECLVEDVYGITLTASLSALEVADSHCIENMASTDCCFTEGMQREEGKSADQLDSDVSLVTVMVMVLNMLKLDYTMQEKIVGALSLKTPSAELEGYCLMWDLHPYIDDDVMRLAWNMCP